LPEQRDRLLKTANHYRTLADKIDEPGGKWDAVLRSYGLTPAESRANLDLWRSSADCGKRAASKLLMKLSTV